jgi:hypothetical protein
MTPSATTLISSRNPSIRIFSSSDMTTPHA